MFYRITYSIAQPVLKLLSSVAVVHGNGFPMDHQLILKVQKTSYYTPSRKVRFSTIPPHEYDRQEREKRAQRT